MPKGIKDTRVLNEDEKNLAYDLVLNGTSLAKVAETLGFPNRLAFYKYCQRDLEFYKEIQATRLAGCIHLEDKVLDIPNQFFDPAMARVSLECHKTAMGWMDPAKYSPKVDVTVNQTISLKSAIDAAEQRIIDVTPMHPQLISTINDIL